MILRRVARPLLGSVFVLGGVNMLRQRDDHIAVSQSFLDKAADPQRRSGESADSAEASGSAGAAGSAGALPGDPVTMVQVEAAVKIAAGTMLSLGVLPRVASALLLTSLVPTTLTSHAFWEEKDPEQRQEQLVEFLRNAGLAGGLLLAVADTGGKPSLGWRARHTTELASHQVQGAAGTVQRKAGKAAVKTGLATEKAALKAAKVSSTAGTRAGKATGAVTGAVKGKGKAVKGKGKAMKAAKGAVKGAALPASVAAVAGKRDKRRRKSAFGH
ncbi:DoxX family membrane protein [Saccharomonospora sp. NB11]|uniref:DoxX family membrane protein n=1 Tax=Saccharomonospora sp. NB11 TaxID=1642298 RepID=UPI0018D09AD2|nr:DoxX family membrane protein [Saccharomonospora sp. NB11]